jgi:hypothetical protein
LGISTTAARSPAVRVGTGDADVTAVAAAVAAATDAASCCGPVAATVAGSGSPVAAALLLTLQNRTQVHRKPTGDLVTFLPRRVLPKFVNPRIGSKLLGFSI